jgi:RNA polymerase sigma-70 factor (ECF subfamily)
MVLLPAVANGQPAFGLYMIDADGVHRPFQLQVLDITADGVAHVVAFFSDTLEDDFARLGLPAVPPATVAPRVAQPEMAD